MSALLLAYGTLRDGVPKHLDAALPQLRTVRSRVLVPGELYDVGEWPAAVVDWAALRGERPVSTQFVADLMQLDVAAGPDCAAALAVLDAYEDLDPATGTGPYRRASIPLAALGVTLGQEGSVSDEAWVYDRVAPVEGLRRIEARPGRPAEWTVD